MKGRKLDYPAADSTERIALPPPSLAQSGTKSRSEEIQRGQHELAHLSERFALARIRHSY
jgi:hypothetical protein